MGTPARANRPGELWSSRIWSSGSLRDRSLKGRYHAFLRVLSITASTFTQTKTASRAADLSFSLMLGLGPLVAIIMLVATKALGQRDPNLAVHVLNELISFAAPQLNQLDNPGSRAVAVNPELVRMLNGFIRGAQSGAAGIVGGLSLVLVVLLLFKSIEDVFNEIWGVRRGRTVLMRIAFYWALLMLAGVLFLGSVTLVGAGTFVNMEIARLPFGGHIVRLLQMALPLVSFVLLVGVLALFYHLIPNTKVRWHAAITGAIVVAILLTANNYLQFVYVRRVLFTKSLFGSLGVIPVLMFGLYIFWLFVLIGGQISYAVQNVHSLNGRVAWRSLSSAHRERLSLGVLMCICRRHFEGGAPLSAPQIAQSVNLPDQVLNECVNQIVDLGFVVASPGTSGETVYLPARPLSEITLYQFKTAIEGHADAPVAAMVEVSDPVVREFGDALERQGADGLFSQSVEALLRRHQLGK